VAAPEFVPVKPMEDVRAYSSPPRRPESWTPERPGDLLGAQPRGARFGSQGPDQGYALLLVERFRSKLFLGDGEHFDDVAAGCLGIALKRASLLGRAPVAHDLTLAFTLWGFLDPAPPADLVALRRRLFAEVASPHHYLEQRRLVDAVPATTLRKSHTTVAEQHVHDWRALLDLTGLE
jgi:hypothetical protein